MIVQHLGATSEHQDTSSRWTGGWRPSSQGASSGTARKLRAPVPPSSRGRSKVQHVEQEAGWTVPEDRLRADVAAAGGADAKAGGMSHVIIIGGGAWTRHRTSSEPWSHGRGPRAPIDAGGQRPKHAGVWLGPRPRGERLARLRACDDAPPGETRLGDRTVAASDTYGTRWIYADGMRHPAPMSPPALLRSTDSLASETAIAARATHPSRPGRPERRCIRRATPWTTAFGR